MREMKKEQRSFSSSLKRRGAGKGSRSIALLTLVMMLVLGTGMTTLAAQTWVTSKGGKKTLSGYTEVKTSGVGGIGITKSKKNFILTAGSGGTATVKCYSGKKVTNTIQVVILDSPVASYDTSTLYMKKGSSKTIKASLFTKYKKCKVSYSSSKKSVVSVSSKGKLTAKKNGTAKITATVSYGGTKIASFSKTVKVSAKGNEKKNKSQLTYFDGKTRKYKKITGLRVTCKYSSVSSSYQAKNADFTVSYKLSGGGTMACSEWELEGRTTKDTYHFTVTAGGLTGEIDVPLKKSSSGTASDTKNSSKTVKKTPEKLEITYKGPEKLDYDEGSPARKYFTVKAHYTDGTSKTVTAYKMNSSMLNGIWNVKFSYTENGSNVLADYGPIQVEQITEVTNITYNGSLPIAKDKALKNTDFTVTVKYEKSGSVKIPGNKGGLIYSMREQDGVITISFSPLTGYRYSKTFKRAE